MDCNSLLRQGNTHSQTTALETKGITEDRKGMETGGSREDEL